MWPNHANLVKFKAEILNGKFHVLRIVSCRPEFCNLIKKESPAQVFSCEFHNIFKNISFTEHLCMTDFFDSLYVKIIGCSKSSHIISWSDHEILQIIRGSSHRRCSMKKVFLKVLQHLQESTCGKQLVAEPLFQ